MAATNERLKDRAFQLCDLVRETGFAIHRYHGPGHLEKIYENALAHRLRKQGIDVKQQHPLNVYDEDGAILGEYIADLLIENTLIVESKATRAVADEHVAQILGYLRASRLEHGVLVNFGAAKFQVKKYAMSDAVSPPQANLRMIGGLFAFLLFFALFCILCGHSLPVQ